jgi:DNA-binding SARP family transcriptional activator/tetratricopeptide (TPR) repeat protein
MKSAIAADVMKVARRYSQDVDKAVTGFRPAGYSALVQFCVLGPVEIQTDDGRTFTPSRRHERALLAILLLEAGRTVTTNRLAQLLWDDNPPDRAQEAIRTYVTRLRGLLARVGVGTDSVVLVTERGGYTLKAPPDTVDAHRFRTLLDQAAQATDPAARDQLLRAALDLWRGPVLQNAGSERLREQICVGLEELRGSATEELMATGLALGRHRELIAELAPLTAAHPTRERLYELHMIALHRAGRTADALAVYRRARAYLADQLGLQPGSRLRELHQAILRDEPIGDVTLRAIPVRSTLDPGEMTGRGAVPETDAEAVLPFVTPAQLPPVPSDFTGRVEQIRDLVTRLSPDPSATGVPMCLITGQGGVGKSTLAVRVAHELGAAYPDGQLFAQLHGMTETPVAAETVLARFLGALGVPPADLPHGLEERAERYRSIVAGRRILVVLDDAYAERQVRPLLPGSPSCAVLVTSRARLAGLAGAQPIELPVLDEAEATDLLARITGPERIAAEPEAARRLLRQAAWLPLAVRIVGVRLTTRRHWTLQQLSARLTDEARRLDELVVGDQQIRATIAVSYHALDETPRTALRRLGFLGLPDFPAWVVGALLGAADPVADDAIEQLVDAQLLTFARIDAAGQTRYQLHDLLRIYAGERAQAEEDAATRNAAVRRVMAGWLERVNAVRAGNPTGGLVLQRPPADAAARHPRLVSEPRAWLDADQHALVASVERAAALDLDDLACDLASALCGSLFAVANLFDAWTRTHDAALAAARRAGNRAAEALLLAEFGQLRYKQDRYDEARTYFLQALEVFRENGDIRGEAATLAALATANHEQGHFAQALHFFGLARAVFREMGDEVTAAYTDRLVGLIHVERGDLAHGAEALRAALATFRRNGSRRGEAMTLRTTSLLHRASGDYQQAYEVAEQARSIFRELRDELLEAYSMRSAGKALVRLNRSGEAMEPLQRALHTSRALHDRWGEAMSLRNLGELYLSREQWSDAETHLRSAIQLWQAMDLPLNRARTLRDLAAAVEGTGDPETAALLRAEARDTFRRYGTREEHERTA